MKVMSEGMTFEVVEESPSFYIGRLDESFGCTLIDKSDAKVVQEPAIHPAWRDVTAECEWYDEGGEGALFYHSPCGRKIRVQDTNGFRLTKISGPLQPHVAFIVEKQE